MPYLASHRPIRRLACISFALLSAAACSDSGLTPTTPTGDPVSSDPSTDFANSVPADNSTTGLQLIGPVVPAGSEVAEGAPGQQIVQGSLPQPGAISFGLQSSGSGPGEKSANLISMAGDWPSWSGQYTGIYYDGGSNQLFIPAPAWPGQMITGVRRFDVALQEGVEYSLSLTATDSQAATIIFLFNNWGQLIDVKDLNTGITSAWAKAKSSTPLRFIAPAGVSGFYLQVQNAWSATAATNMATSLVNASETVTPPLTQQPSVTVSGASPFALGDRPSGYDALFFGDEFDGNSLDRSKWCTRYDYGGGPALQVPDGECTKFNAMGVLDYANAFEEQRFRDFNEWGWPMHVVGDGTIKLLATKSLTSNWYAKYEAAALRGKKVFKPDWQTSYFVTARLKFPNL
ncbi:MAG: hypothetical protein WA888_09165, partial [Burkholderiaceae bacterium]